jgi:uncharacterized membrane protein
LPKLFFESGLSPAQGVVWLSLSNIFSNDETSMFRLRDLRSFFVLIILLGMAKSWVCAQDTTGGSTPPASAERVSFSKQIQPLLEAKCVHCHGSENAEEDINFHMIDEWKEHLVLAGDPEKSELYEVLVSTGKNKMPPEDETPLTESEITLVKTWIEQGADSSDAVAPANLKKPSNDEDKQVESDSLMDPKGAIHDRIWTFSGFFHPAIVHFPIALFVVGAFFVIFCYRNLVLANEASFYCLTLGSLGAIVACIAGWPYAAISHEQTGLYPPLAELTDTTKEIFWHRTSGLIVAVVSVIVWIIAWRSRSQPYSDGGGSWKLGLVLLAIMVGLVGHQGGELTYGEGLYFKKFKILFPEAFEENKSAPSSETESTTAVPTQKNSSETNGGLGSKDAANPTDSALSGESNAGSGEPTKGESAGSPNSSSLSQPNSTNSPGEVPPTDSETKAARTPKGNAQNPEPETDKKADTAPADPKQGDSDDQNN